MRWYDRPISRRYERRMARRYNHSRIVSCSQMFGRWTHGCLRCYWRGLTGQSRRDRQRFIENLRKRRDATSISRALWQDERLP